MRDDWLKEYYRPDVWVKVREQSPIVELLKPRHEKLRRPWRWLRWIVVFLLGMIWGLLVYLAGHGFIPQPAAGWIPLALSIVGGCSIAVWSIRGSR